MILGVTGTIGAGKDLAARYLESKNFQHLSTADILREEAVKKGLSLERESLRIFSNQLKKEKSGDYLAREAVARIVKDNVIISAIRAAEEVDYLKNLADFYLVFIDAPIEERYERIRKRSRIGEKEIKFDDFKKKEDLEMSGLSSQRLDYCREKADFIISNTGSTDELNKKIDSLLIKIRESENK